MKIKVFGKPVTKQRMFNWFWLLDAWQSRGSGLIAQLRFTNPGMVSQFAIIAIALKLKMSWVPWIILIFYIFTTWLGKYDADKLGYWAYSNEKEQTYKVNPYQRRIERRLMRLETKLDVLEEGDIYDKE
jgi:hypothetical protein